MKKGKKREKKKKKKEYFQGILYKTSFQNDIFTHVHIFTNYYPSL